MPNRPPERAERAYQVYANMGDDRSLRRLAEETGISVHTLEKYSQKYHWQAELEKERQEKRERLRKKRAKEFEDDLYAEYIRVKTYLNAINLAEVKITNGRDFKSAYDVLLNLEERMRKALGIEEPTKIEQDINVSGELDTGGDLRAAIALQFDLDRIRQQALAELGGDTDANEEDDPEQGE